MVSGDAGPATHALFDASGVLAIGEGDEMTCRAETAEAAFGVYIHVRTRSALALALAAHSHSPRTRNRSAALSRTCDSCLGSSIRQ